MEAFETSEQNMHTDARKPGEFCRPPKYCYGDHFPPILLKGLENYWEQRHRYKRAKLARRGNPPRIPRRGVQSDVKGNKLQMEEKDRVISLTDVRIIPKLGSQGGETIVGTLEGHGNGFIYTTSSFCMHFLFNTIKTSVFRLGDKRMPPLVHFHLHDPIIMGREKTRDLQFHLVQCPAGQNRSDLDSDKIEKEKEKQIRDGGRDQDLKIFVAKVDNRWSSLKPHIFFNKIWEEDEFCGVLPSKAPAEFALTLFSLIVFVETPFAVIPLDDIEIVNLALLRPGEIDMTVIFKDCKEDKVLQINSIPLASFADITHRFGNVQYYVNAEKPDWKLIVKDKADFPEKFIENGGWDYFKLEDSAYYKETEADLKCFKTGNEEI